MAERDVANFGLLGYPVLQTVDISIVRGELVPVGEDQVSHLEISREIVRDSTGSSARCLVEPQPLVGLPARARVRRPKMSKSLDNAIGLVDDPDTIRAKVRSFITDPQKVRLGDPQAGDLPDLRTAHAVLTRHRRLDARSLPLRGARLRGLQDEPRRSPHRGAPADPGTTARAGLGAGVGVEGPGRGEERVGPVVRETMDAVRDAMGFSRP